MERFVWKQLKQWKDKTNRKPLLVRGARQVGKTYIIKAFAEAEFENMVYVNCDEDPRIKSLFQTDYDIQRIIKSLEIITNEKITAGKTCIVLDEIQEVPRGLASLKYFCEKAPEYHIIVAGSLMGIATHKDTSFPVGKINIIDLFPMNFHEFLLAMDENALLELLIEKDWNTIKVFKDKYISLLRQYYFVGGMPEAVLAHSKGEDVNVVREIQKEILLGYDTDISKHAPDNEIARIRMVWRSIPGQLAKDNKKFIYKVLKDGARAKEFETAIEWLKDYGIAYKISRISSPQLPLSMFEDPSAFKLFVLDCGLFGAMNMAAPDQILLSDNIFEQSKGAFTEEYVLQQLITLPNTPIYYWSNNASSSELDFVIQHDNRAIPIEVKAEENLKSKSLKSYVQTNKGLKGIRFSMSDYRDQEWMENVPLYAVLNI